MLRTLNDYYLGQDCQYLCGDRMTIADYFGAALLTVGEITGNDLSGYANIESWLKAVKSMPSWSVANDIHNSFVASMQDKSFIRLS
jgi:glutathione S-transferase